MAVEHTSKLVIQNDSQANVEANVGEIVEIIWGRNTSTNAIGYSIDGGSNWIWLPISSGGGALADLSDVDLTGLADNDILVYDDASGDWLPETPSAGSPLTVAEIDGTPSVSDVSTINVPNGTLTDGGSGEITLDFGSAATDGNAIHDNVADEISAITEKTTLANDDLFIIEDSEASGVKKKVKSSNLPSGGGGVSIAFVKRNSNAAAGNDYAISNGSWAEIDSTNLRLTLAASVGDVIGIGVSGIWRGNLYAALSAASIVSGSIVNFIDTGTGTGGADGIPGWDDVSNSVSPGSNQHFSGEVPYTVQAGDISSGTITLSLVGYAYGAGKTIFCRAGYPLHFFIKNYGQ